MLVLVVERVVRPRGPYALALCAQARSDATRAFVDGVLVASLHGPRGPERALARQLPDGSLLLAAESGEGLEKLRFCLAVDDDHSQFLRRFRRDPLLGPTILRLGGLRPLRLGTVAHALLRALCGQLVEARRARAIERRIVRATTPALGRLHAPPRAADLARLAPAELRALGLHARRAASLVRLCRGMEVERLRELPTHVAASRLERERGLGPWSSGLVCLEGLGRYERGLVGDLGLVKLVSALRGREAQAWETEELLAGYGEWAGLASVYLLAGLARGLVPVSIARYPSAAG